jgi:excisionase family DNA binding protein
VRAAVRAELVPLRAALERLEVERRRDPVSIPEAARRLGVTVRSVNRWIRDGSLKVVPIGGLRYVVLPSGEEAVGPRVRGPGR